MQIHNGSVSAHLKRLAKAGWGGVQAPPDPEAVKIDHELGYLVEIYERLRRQNHVGMAINPITFTEIWHFNDLAKTELDPFDLDTLEKLDAVWRKCLPKGSQS